MVLLLRVGPPFVNPGVCPPGQHLDSHLEGASLQLSASIPSRGRARWVGRRRWRLSRRRQSPQRASFYFPLSLFGSMVLYSWILLDMLVGKREPTPCYRDAYSVGTPKWAY